MKLATISVQGLFERFDHDLVFKPNERITIMIGPNGFGKTMILQILNALFNLELNSLHRMPFQHIVVHFDDSSILEVSRLQEQRDPAIRQNRPPLVLEYKTPAFSPKRYRLQSRPEDDESFQLGMIEDTIPSLYQIGPMLWQDHITDEILDLDDVLTEYGDRIPFRSRPPSRPPRWMIDIQQSLPVYFIGTERLTHSSKRAIGATGSRHPYPQPSPERTVRRYSDQLAQKVRQNLADYATLSQSLDRTFPVRLVEEPTSPVLSVQDLTRKLAEVEDKRVKIIDAGLLAQEHEPFSVPLVSAVDDARRGVLAVYAQDALLKLSVFDDLYARVGALKRIANARFLYKQVSVSTEGLKVSTLGGSDIDLEMLSSGEQHELVLLYDLLFGIVKNSLVMIDEPELSLDIAWQEQILSDFEEMAQLSDFHVLLATHSPQIIGDRWDLTVQLQGPIGT